jgi:hypothetical protein
MKEPKRLKRVVIKEEFVALTGSVEKAIILNQLLYWSERIKDFDKFITEENARKEKHGIEEIEDLCHGWIYKTSLELSEETMLGKSPQTIRRHLDELIEKGWIQARKNPKYKWDQTYQYRVNIVKIQSDLFELGYPLDGYEHSFSPISKMENGETTENIAISILENGEPKMEIQTVKTGDAIPEITTEITTEIEEERITEGGNMVLPASNSESGFQEGENGLIDDVVQDLPGTLNAKKITEEGKESLTAADPEKMKTIPYPFSNPETIYEKPPQSQGHDNKDPVEMVKEKLGVGQTLAFLLVARCQDKLDKVIDQLVNAKKPIQNMTAYLLTLLAHPDQWYLFMENVENEFLTRERPKKKREVKPKRPDEEREIYIPPSAKRD